LSSNNNNNNDNNIKNLLVLFVPTKYRKPVKCHQSYPASIKKLQAKKRELWRLRHIPACRQKYITVSAQYETAVEKFHVDNETKLITLNSKKFYSHLNKKLTSHNSIPNLRKDKNYITSNADKAAEFLNTFNESFTADDGLLGFIPVQCQPTDIQPDFSPTSIAKHLKSVNSRSAAGPDGYPGIFWHSLYHSLALPLSLIFTKSFITGNIPLCWKQSIITPVFKKGDAMLASNYRPISLTSIACKIMESVVRDALLTHFNTHKLISVDQHGFLAKHSTGSQLLECLNDWTAAIEQNRCVDVCYIDFSRAFDSVSLPKLIQKLVAYGISGNCINWLKSFLLNRSFCVKVNSVLSGCAQQISGVPQGSVLGPICFVLFINDISKCVKYCKLKLYADDVKLYFDFNCNNWSNLLQKDIDAIAEWANMWQLNISISKTCMLHIGASVTKSHSARLGCWDAAVFSQHVP
jgi:hypothetical protein